MYVSLEQFNKFTGVHDEPEKQQSFIDAAEGIVTNYLGYDLGFRKYLTVANGNGREDVQLEARPIREILRVVVNDIEIPITQFEATNEYIFYKNEMFPEGRRNITIVYNAGWDANADILDIDNDYFDGGDAALDTTDYLGSADAATVSPILNAGNALLVSKRTTIPAEIISTILRIAALLQSESDSNIGVTSKSFGDSGSRSFVNYTNFNKFLLPISKFRLKRI